MDSLSNIRVKANTQSNSDEVTKRELITLLTRLQGYYLPTISSRVYDSSRSGVANSSGSITANQLILVPFLYHSNLTISEIGVNVTTQATAGSLGKCAIYSDLNGVPDQLLLTSADFSIASVALSMVSASFTLNALTPYWLGYCGNATASLSTVTLALTPQTTPTSFVGRLTRSHTFANSFPSSFNYTTSDLTSVASAPAIKLRAV
jgi:hypothetical protein